MKRLILTSWGRLLGRSLFSLAPTHEGLQSRKITVTDPRVNNTAAFFKFQMIDVRSQNGGHVSVFNLGPGAPVIWMASSDGLTASDAMWLQEGSHQHFDFGFSKSGIYEVDFVTSGFRDVNSNGFYDEGIDPYIESGVETIYFEIDLAGGAHPYTIPAAMNGRAPVASDDPFQVVSGSSVNGNVFYVLPQSENTDLVYLGFGAEELAEGIFVGDAIRLRLASVSGPGHFSIWLDGATSTTPSLVMASSDGIRANDEYVVNAGSHAHINFGFTKVGTYKVAFVATGVLASDGSTTTSEIVTYTFRVGSELLVDHEILIAPRSAARAGRPLQMDVQIAGMPTGGSNMYTYRFDLDGNGTIDRVVQSAANPMILSDVVYTTRRSDAGQQHQCG